jgi:hypothetical protein
VLVLCFAGVHCSCRDHDGDVRKGELAAAVLQGTWVMSSASVCVWLVVQQAYLVSLQRAAQQVQL